MARLKRLTARQVLTVLLDSGFAVVSTRGSHAKLKREIEGGPPQVLTIPLHRELATGTIQAIYRQALRFIPEAELRPRFYGPD
jgi:predicted RNA binding protein YcfA (HicA-like mRNA interferase family)